MKYYFKSLLLSLLLILSFNIHSQSYSCDMFWQGNQAMSSNTPVSGKWSKTFQKTSGSTNNAYLVNADSYNNKWYNSSTPYNQVFTLNWGGGSGSGSDGQLSTGATDGKYYTFHLIDQYEIVISSDLVVHLL